MSSLWRTERPRFPLYTPDGRGRDYYIKYDNGGYWAEQFQLKKIPDYERARYSNFHTLFHQAAPFKYWGNGHGRETYILQTNGLFHDQKPLCAYKLTDFLRTNKTNSFVNNYKKKIYMSVSEKKYNNELRRIEKKLIKRLYTEPMYVKTSIHKSRNVENTLDDQMGKTFTAFNFKASDKELENSKEECKTLEETDVKAKTLINWHNKEKKFENVKMNNMTRNRFSKTCSNFHKKSSDNKGLTIKTDDDFHFNVTNRKFKNFFDYNKICSTINYIRPKNDLRYIDPRSKYNRTMTVTFNFKPKPKSDKIKIKKIKAS
jgi:hypothetical protein